ncbi:MAG: hypothetical protein LBI13_03570 [Streptococcaceae bacterium]|jgi:hypothetical protein|nr:hypothetical protein [Streptococcaceae bacterium]
MKTTIKIFLIFVSIIFLTACAQQKSKISSSSTSTQQSSTSSIKSYAHKSAVPTKQDLESFVWIFNDNYYYFTEDQMIIIPGVIASYNSDGKLEMSERASIQNYTLTGDVFTLNPDAENQTTAKLAWNSDGNLLFIPENAKEGDLSGAQLFEIHEKFKPLPY